GAAGGAAERARVHAGRGHTQPGAGGPGRAAAPAEPRPAGRAVTWSDAALLALRSLGRRGARSLLAGLGVALGTALLVALLSISGGADSKIVSQLSHGGPAAAIHVSDALPDPAGYDSDSLKEGAHRDLDDAAFAKIQNSPHVTSVVPVLAV